MKITPIAENAPRAQDRMLYFKDGLVFELSQVRVSVEMSQSFISERKSA